MKENHKDMNVLTLDEFRSIVGEGGGPEGVDILPGNFKVGGGPQTGTGTSDLLVHSAPGGGDEGVDILP